MLLGVPLTPVVGQFDCGSRIRLDRARRRRIFREWRQLSDVVAAPSTNALTQSSWHRIRVTRQTSRRKAGMTSHPKRPRDPTSSLVALHYKPRREGDNEREESE